MKGFGSLDIPIMQLFRTPNNAYIYETNKSEFVPINNDTFLYLRNILNGENNFDESIPWEVDALKEKGYCLVPQKKFDDAPQKSLQEGTKIVN